MCVCGPYLRPKQALLFVAHLCVRNKLDRHGIHFWHNQFGLRGSRTIYGQQKSGNHKSYKHTNLTTHHQSKFFILYMFVTAFSCMNLGCQGLCLPVPVLCRVAPDWSSELVSVPGMDLC